MMEKIDRKKFFGIVAASSIFGFFASSYPNKLLKKISNATKKNVVVKIHPDAVKRNKV
jgi:hypothetical protein